MLEVEVRNFQSIEKATFQIDGFTVVVGRSNIGKSALVRAMKAALTGASVSSFVRHGPACLRRTKQAKTCKCYASVHFRGPDLDLLWEKGDSINRYTYNGTIYDKAERGTPEFLQPAFSPVKVGDRQDLLQVADQFSPIFLLDQSGGAVADTLSDVARLDRINEAMRLAEKDRKEAVATRKVREKDVQALEERLESYTGLDDALTAVKDLEDAKTSIYALDKTLLDLDQYMADLSSLALSIKSLTAAKELAIPVAQTLEDTHKQLTTLNKLVTDLTTKETAVSSLQGVEDIHVPSLQSHTESLKRLTDLTGWVNQVVEIKSWLMPWKAVEDAKVPTDETVLAARDLLTLLDGQLSKYETLATEVTNLEESVSTVSDELTRLTKEQRELGVCPTCIRPIAECEE